MKNQEKENEEKNAQENEDENHALTRFSGGKRSGHHQSIIGALKAEAKGVWPVQKV